MDDEQLGTPANVEIINDNPVKTYESTARTHNPDLPPDEEEEVIDAAIVIVNENFYSTIQKIIAWCVLMTVFVLLLFYLSGYFSTIDCKFDVEYDAPPRRRPLIYDI